MNETLLIVERPVEGVVQLTLNRPDSKNALSKALRTALVTQLTTLAEECSRNCYSHWCRRSVLCWL
ncbi:MAG TPA: hypothetical protein EYQ22_00865 [Gammaproteobacteria bacterium]|nr:hypothetical protein [Gammaproteobacteria bacterium]